MGTLTVIAGVLLAAFSAQLAFEFREWTPRWVELLIESAVRRLPTDLQDRMGEEWQEFVSATPGHAAKFFRAIGLNWAAICIAHETLTSTSVWHSTASRTIGFILVILFAPLLLIGTIVWRGGPLFEKSDKTIRFRSDNERVRRTLSKTYLNELPTLWNVVTGEITLDVKAAVKFVRRLLRHRRDAE